jgi:arylsulfatase A-like enzyme
MAKYTLGILVITVATTLVYILFYLNGVPKSVCPPECNVILISIDSLRYDRLGINGYLKNVSPSIDAWAKNAVVFDNYITSAYLTPISEMALHTGYPPLASGLVRFDAILDPRYLTIAQILKSEGYHTVAMGSSPEFFYTSRGLTYSFMRGFDEYFKRFYAEDGFSQGFNKQRDIPDEALDWLEKAPSSEPFFLWLAVGTVHWPYGQWDFPGKEEYTGWLKNENGIQWGDGLRKIYDGKVWSLKNPGEVIGVITDEDDKFIQDSYDSGITVTDEFLGEFFDKLEKEGLSENTIVILHSEHGEDLGEHGYYSHHDIYDTGVHVPLIIYVPNTKPMRISEQISSTDILPTLLDYLNIGIPPQLDGISFRPVMSGGPQENDRMVFTTRTPFFQAVLSTLAEGDIEHGTVSDQLTYPLIEFNEIDKESPIFDAAVRTPDWKFIWRKGRLFQQKYRWYNLLSNSFPLIDEYELYDIHSDPYELNNVYDEYPDVASHLSKVLKDWVAEQESISAVRKVEGEVQPYF